MKEHSLCQTVVGAPSGQGRYTLASGIPSSSRSAAKKNNIKTLRGLKVLPQRIPHSQSSGSLHVPPLSAPTHPSHLCSCLGRTGVTSWLPPGPPWRQGRLATLASRTSTARELRGRWYRFQRIDASLFRNSSWRKRCPGWPLAAYMCPKHPDTFKQQKFRNKRNLFFLRRWPTLFQQSLQYRQGLP